MNDENLIPGSRRSKSEARENGKKGGIASGIARRDKRDSRERMKMLLQLPCPDGEGGVLRSDITGKPISVGEAIDTALIQKGISGNVKAIQTIYELLDLYNPKKADITVTTRSVAEIDAEIERLKKMDEMATGRKE